MAGWPNLPAKPVLKGSEFEAVSSLAFCAEALLLRKGEAAVGEAASAGTCAGGADGVPGLRLRELGWENGSDVCFRGVVRDGTPTISDSSVEERVVRSIESWTGPISSELKEAWASYRGKQRVKIKKNFSAAVARQMRG